MELILGNIGQVVIANAEDDWQVNLEVGRAVALSHLIPEGLVVLRLAVKVLIPNPLLLRKFHEVGP